MVTGLAIHAAARDARAQVLHFAAGRLGCPAADLSLEGAFLMGLLGGRVVGPIGGAIITIPALVAHGSDPAAAAHQAYGAVWGMVLRQASMISFVDTFRAMGIVFLLVIPLVFLMKRPKGQGRGAAMH